MWLFAMFDLPVVTKLEKQRYVRFRRLLLTEGFFQLQYSVYARPCGSEETAAALRRLLREGMPEAGQVRLLTVTDRQFGKMECYFGKKRKKTEEPPRQLMLF